MNNGDGERDFPGRELPSRVAAPLSFHHRPTALFAAPEDSDGLRTLLEKIPDIVYRYEIVPRRRFTYVNSACLTINGYSPAEHYAHPDLGMELVHPEDRARFISWVESMSLNPEASPRTLALRWIRKDRNIIWVEVRCTPIYTPSGNLAAIEGVVRDITHLQRMEEIHGDEEAKYRGIFHQANDAIFLMEGDRYIECNPKAEGMFGCSREKIIGRSFAEFSPAYQKSGQESEQLGRERIQAALTGRLQTFEWVHHRLDRTFFEAEVSLGLVQSAGKNRLLAIVRDISDRKKIEKALRESEEKFRILTETTSAAIAIHQKGRICYSNPSQETLTGYAREELLGLNFANLIHPGDRDRAEDCGILSTRRKNACPRGEFRIVAKGGEERWADIRTAKILFEGVPADIATLFDISERKRSEENLRASQQLIRKTFASIVEAIFILDAQTVSILDCNPAAARIFGYTREEMIGRTTNFLHADDSGLQALGEQLHTALEDKGMPLLREFKMKRKNGEVFFSENNVMPLEDETGKPMGWVKVVRDISKRKQNEEALRESEKSVKALLNATVDPLMLMDSRETIAMMNEAAAKHLNTNLEEGLGTSLARHLPPQVVARRRVHFRTARKTGKHVHFEEEQNGTTFEHTCYPVLDEKGQTSSLAFYSKDITEHKKAEDALIESEKRYRLLAENVTDIIWTMGLELHFSFVSPSVTRMLGYGVEEFMGLTLDKIIPPESFEWVQKIYAEEMATERKSRKDLFRSRTLEIEIIRKDGSPLWTEQRVTFLRDDGGTAIGILGITRDITGRKKTEEQLRAYSARLQTIREEERTSIAREIHDELGQSLTGLKMDVSWISGKLAKNQKDLFKKADVMCNLIDATIQSVRKICAELRPAVLDDLGLAAALEWQAQEFEERTGIQCLFFSSEDDFRLGHDFSTAVFRIFQEALTNITRHAQARRVQVSLREREGFLIMDIQDNGRGMTEKEISNPMSLGILGMRERAALFGGKIKIKSSPGKGTILTVRLPLQR